MSLLLSSLLTVSSQTTNDTFMLHLHSPEASETVPTGRNIDLSAVLSETRAILDRYFKILFTKEITIKKTIISNWTYFSYADWLVSSLCKTKMPKCFALVWHYFHNTHVKTHAILSFLLNWTCSNVVLCLQRTPTVIYLYLVWVINWQPVWLEYCWHAVNLDEQTLDIGVLRKNYFFFLECTFDMNNCYMYNWENKYNNI